MAIEENCPRLEEENGDLPSQPFNPKSNAVVDAEEYDQW